MDSIQTSPLVQYISTFFSDATSPWFFVVLAVVVHSLIFIVLTCALIAYMDQKIGADIQMRIGINRAGPAGIFQSLSDFIKLFFKQDNLPLLSRRYLFQWGPLLAVIAAIIAFGAIPLADSWVISDLEWSSVFVVTMLGVVQLMLFWAGYSSGSHWAVLGSFRTIVLLTSYIVPVVIALLPAIFVAGSASFTDIVKVQSGGPWKWMIFSYPPTIISFIVMYIGLFIWQGRAPFDLASAGKELGGGLVAEYSGLRKGFLDFLQYLQFLLATALVVTVYLGGWNFPLGLDSMGRAASIVQCLFFLVKIFVLVLISIWVRWSLPRMRIDQLVNLSWKVLVPAALVSSFGTALWLVITHGRGIGDFL